MEVILESYDILIFSSIDSTNEEAKRLARAGVQGQFLIYADNQTSGRGQGNNQWQSLEGNLNLSILLETKKELDKSVDLVFMAANALASAINLADKNKVLANGDICVKWPNDILINGKKVAGILVETIKVQQKLYTIIGIGVNIASAPTIKEHPATCLHDVLKYGIAKDKFMSIFLHNFDRKYKKWLLDSDFMSIKNQWLEYAYKLNQIVTLDYGKNRASGIFIGLDLDGAAIIELSNGKRVKMHYGEIINNATA